MCLAPSVLPTGEPVACRSCRLCRENRINDWVGRCIAESKTARKSFSVTLTYGRDNQNNVEHEAAAVLTYSDVQKFFKRLRTDGYPLKYFCVGEYGTLKARSHWHLMLYFQGPYPEVKLRERTFIKQWEHGFTFWDEPTPQAVRYVCKYIQKDIGKAQRQGHLAMSKKPPLGHEFFMGLAERYVQNGLSPDGFYYHHGVKDFRGKRINFKMSGKTRDNFCEHFIKTWKEKKGNENWPHSDFIEKYQESVLPEDLTRITVIPKAPPISRRLEGATIPVFTRAYNSYECELDGTRWFWILDQDGIGEWRRNPEQAEAVTVAKEAQALQAAFEANIDRLMQEHPGAINLIMPPRMRRSRRS